MLGRFRAAGTSHDWGVLQRAEDRRRSLSSTTMRRVSARGRCFPNSCMHGSRESVPSGASATRNRSNRFCAFTFYRSLVIAALMKFAARTCCSSVANWSTSLTASQPPKTLTARFGTSPGQVVSYPPLPRLAPDDPGLTSGVSSRLGTNARILPMPCPRFAAGCRNGHDHDARSPTSERTSVGQSAAWDQRVGSQVFLNPAARKHKTICFIGLRNELAWRHGCTPRLRRRKIILSSRLHEGFLTIRVIPSQPTPTRWRGDSCATCTTQCGSLGRELYNVQHAASRGPCHPPSQSLSLSHAFFRTPARALRAIDF